MEAGEEGAEHIAALGDLADVLRAAPGDPHRRMRLLVDARPDVDVAVLEMLALPVERPVDRGHRLEDEIMRLPEARHLPDRRALRERHLVGHAAHESHLQAAARDDVDHRQLLGDAYRVEAIRDRVAEREEPRALRLPREDGERHRGHRRRAGRGGVVLVHHDVEPELVGEQPFVEPMVIVLGHRARVAVAARQIHAQRGVLLAPGFRAGLLREMVDPHFISSTMRRATRSACSMCGKCPASLTSSKRAPGINALYALPYSGGAKRSASPQRNSTGTRMRCSRALSFGLYM